VYLESGNIKDVYLRTVVTLDLGWPNFKDFIRPTGCPEQQGITNGTNFKAKIKTIYSHSLQKAYHIKDSFAELTPLVFYIVAIQVAWFVILLFLTASAAIVNQFMLFHASGRDFAL